ncbi:MAG: hypothetical protein R3C60_10270 [Parvularculaceae bacterium]
MILRRITNAFRRQDWFTVGIETLIVVLGVFLGLQAQEWAADQAEKAGIEAQLSSFREELVQRQDEIDAHKTYIEHRIDDTRTLRSDLMNPDQPLSQDDIYRLAMSSVRTIGLNVTFHGFNELSASGALSKIKSAPLLKGLYQWDASLTNLRSTERDVKTLRDVANMPDILGSLSFGNMARTDPRFSDLPADHRFNVDVEGLRTSRDFDNALVSRLILEQQNFNALIDFQNATNDLITALETERKK